MSKRWLRGSFWWKIDMFQKNLQKWYVYFRRYYFRRIYFSRVFLQSRTAPYFYIDWGLTVKINLLTTYVGYGKPLWNIFLKNQTHVRNNMITMCYMIKCYDLSSIIFKKKCNLCCLYDYLKCDTYICVQMCKFLKRLNFETYS